MEKVNTLRRVFTLDKAIAKRDIPFKMCRPIARGTCDREYIARVQILAQYIAPARFMEAGKTGSTSSAADSTMHRLSWHIHQLLQRTKPITLS